MGIASLYALFAQSVVISVATCDISLRTGHFPATLSNSCR
jgi:hypothetical protein